MRGLYQTTNLAKLQSIESPITFSYISSCFRSGLHYERCFEEKDQRLLQADRIADRSLTSRLPFCRASFLHQGRLLLDAACGECSRSKEQSQRNNHLSVVAQTSVCKGKKSRQDLGSKSIKGKLTVQNSTQPHICVANFYILWRDGFCFYA